MSDDKRRQDRMALGTRGQILLNNGNKIPVSIKDMSSRGAKLILDQYVVVPDDFTVEIFSPDGTKVKRCRCTRQWQKLGEVGVHFLDSKTEPVPQ